MFGNNTIKDEEVHYNCMILCGPKITQKTPEVARIYALTQPCGRSRSAVPRFDWSNSLELSGNFSSASPVSINTADSISSGEI